MTDDNFRAICDLTAKLAAHAFPTVDPEERATFGERSEAMLHQLVRVMHQRDCLDLENLMQNFEEIKRLLDGFPSRMEFKFETPSGSGFA